MDLLRLKCDADGRRIDKFIRLDAAHGSATKSPKPEFINRYSR